MFNLTHIAEAWRIFLRSVYVKIYGVKKYSGTSDEICSRIVEDCWNGKYFHTSSGHFCEFYIRDFGWSVDSLLKLGHKERVHKTLEYALSKYSKKRLTTTITPGGKCVDIFDYGIDSLAFLIRSLRVADAKEIVRIYKVFLEKEIERCFNLCFDKKAGMVRADRHFSSMKDESLRKSSTYDNVMIAMLSSELDRLGLKNPFKEYDIKENIKKYLWSGDYFYDDITKKPSVTGDANIYPFWSGVFEDEEMLKKCISSIRKEKLDVPFPLRYTSSNFIGHNLNIVSWFVEGYEKDSIWMHMGPLYVQLVQKVDKELAARYLEFYSSLIEKNKNFLEVFSPDGKPFKSPFYYADEGMLWAANYLALK